MADFKALHPYVLPELPKCPLPILNRAISDTVREFCRRTLLLRQSDRFTVPIGKNDFQLRVPRNMEVLEIQRVSMDNLDIPLYQEASGVIKIGDKDTGNTIVYYTWQPQNIVTVHPIPDIVHKHTLDIDFSFQTKRDSTFIPDQIFDRWAECLAAKVKAMMMMQAGKAWSNPQYVRPNSDEWWRLLGDARSESFRMYGNPVSAAIYSLDQ